jgi:uncharacterized iron-regulated membrane protein
MSILGPRKVWLQVHLYLGLFAGALLMLLGITGSVLVFSDEIDRALNPQLAASSGVNRTATPDEVVQSVEARTGSRPYMLELPRHGQPHYLAFIKETDGDTRALLVSGASGEVLTDRRFGAYFVSFCRRLHTDLLLGDDVGAVVVPLLGFLGLVSLATGLYLWWPRGNSGWLRVLSFRWQRHPTTLNFELHRVSGFYLLIVLLVVTVSGIYLSMPSPIAAAVGTFADVTPYPEGFKSAAPADGMQPLRLADVARVVTERTPQAVLTGFHVPASLDEAFTVYYRGPDEPMSDFGRSALWIDQYTGQVLHAHEYAQASTADRVFALQILLHNGEIVGTPGEWVVFVSGVAMMLLYGTGFYLWWARRRPKRRIAVAASRA